MYFLIIYISVDLWRIISSLGYNTIELYFFAQTVSTLAVGSSFSWLLCPCCFDKLPSMFFFFHYWLIDEFSVYFLTFWCHKMLWAHYLSTVYVSWPSAWISISPRSPGSFYWEMVTEIKIWALGVLVAPSESLHLGPPSWQSKDICMYTKCPLNIHLSKNVSVYNPQ